MPEPVKIVVVAETEQAAAALQSFDKNSVQGLKDVAAAAKATGERMAGMSYFFRSGMDSIRFALAGGGTRAAFYALDEGIRGLAASGKISFDKIKAAIAGLSPATLGIAGGIGLAATALAMFWKEATDAEEKAIADHNEMVKTLKEMPAAIHQINEAAKAGFLSPETSQKLLSDIGAIRNYVGAGDWTKSIPAAPGTTFPVVNQQPPVGGVPSLFGLPTANSIRDANEQLVKAGFLLKEIGKDGKDTYTVSDKGQALLKIIELRQKLTLEALSGYDKERAAAKQSYDDQLADLNQYIERANSALKEGEAEKLRADLLSGYNRQVADINFKQQEEDQKKSEAAFAESQKRFAEIAADENKKLDADLEASAAKQGKTREQIYQEEFARRTDLLTRQLYAGEIDEEQYTAAVQEATTKRLQAVNAEIKATQKLNEENERRFREMRGRAIESNPFLTEQQKYNQLMAGGYADKTTFGVNPSSMSQNFLAEIVKIKNQWGTMAQEMSHTFGSLINSAMDSVAQNFTHLIEGTESWKKALQNIESVILTDIINAIIRMFEQWIVGMILQATVGKAIAASSTGFSIGIAAAQSAIWATPATLATIASYGGAAAAAPGLISLAEGLTLATIAGREFGGPVEAGRPYIVGEKRPELFVPETDGYIHSSVPQVYSAAQAASRSASSGAGQPKISVNFLTDGNAMNEHARKNPEFTHIMVDIFRKNVHVIRPQGGS